MFEGEKEKKYKRNRQFGWFFFWFVFDLDGSSYRKKRVDLPSAVEFAVLAIF